MLKDCLVNSFISLFFFFNCSAAPPLSTAQFVGFAIDANSFLLLHDLLTALLLWSSDRDELILPALPWHTPPPLCYDTPPLCCDSTFIVELRLSGLASITFTVMPPLCCDTPTPCILTARLLRSSDQGEFCPPLYCDPPPHSAVARPLHVWPHIYYGAQTEWTCFHYLHCDTHPLCCDTPPPCALVVTALALGKRLVLKTLSITSHQFYFRAAWSDSGRDGGGVTHVGPNLQT